MDEMSIGEFRQPRCYVVWTVKSLDSRGFERAYSPRRAGAPCKTMFLPVRQMMQICLGRNVRSSFRPGQVPTSAGERR